MSQEILDDLVNLFSKLPSLGPRSSRRIILHLLKNKDSLMSPMVKVMGETLENIRECSECGNFCIGEKCSICEDESRDGSLICVVESVVDLWAIEKSGVYKGYYHILGGTLSALEGRGPEQLAFDSLVEKVGGEAIKEVILATNATLDGQTTTHYIIEMLKGFDVHISKLTQGVPIGSELDYIDDGTINIAFQTRTKF
jgi:recombination protein RecR